MIPIKVKKWITVRFQKEGIHCYPEALTNPKLEDVSFLGHPHRHMFHFTVSLQVTGDNREVEFIQFKRFLEKQYSEKTLVLDNQSCEMIAHNLIIVIRNEYGNRSVKAEVSEDGENGALIEWIQE